MTANGNVRAPVWRTERQGAVLTAILHRPEVRNALNRQAWEELSKIAGEAGDDESVAAVILAGEGGLFSAGGDMKNAESRGSGLLRHTARLRYLHQVLLRIAGLQVPTIAAVEGAAAGVGWSLALSCDFVIASESAVFLAPFSQRALIPDGGISWHLVRAAGRLRATEILLGQRRISAAEAKSLGLVTEVVAAGEARAEATRLAQTFSIAHRDTTLLTLRMVRKAETGTLAEYLADEAIAASLNLHNPNIADARKAFTAGQT